MKYFTLLALTLFFLCSCDEDEAKVEDFDVVKTNHDTDYWSAENMPQTYYLLEEVRWLEKEGGLGNANPVINRAYDEALLESIEANMTELGYTKVATVDEQNPPDLLIGVQALATTFDQVDFIWDNWYDWWGFYDPWYPGGGYYPVYYQWTEGTIVIEMGDYDSLDKEKKKIDIVWLAGINGLVRNSQAGNLNFIKERVNEAFDQSPYLEVK